jgi:hypothetical protein
MTAVGALVAAAAWALAGPPSGQPAAMVLDVRGRVEIRTVAGDGPPQAAHPRNLPPDGEERRRRCRDFRGRPHRE